jgi:hypothetical protein
MKAIFIVIIAAVTLIGLGYDFANSQFHPAAQKASQQPNSLPVNGAAKEAGVERADMHPEKDLVLANGKGHSSKNDNYEAKDNAGSISEERIQFSGPTQLGFQQGHDVSKNAAEWQDPVLANLDSGDELAGTYVHRKMIYPQKSIVGHAGQIDDDLLIMEARSEDRLAEPAL